MPLLEAAGIVKVFGKLTALDGAALTVEDNEFHGLIGPNGSGKSTLMKCIAGAEVPTQGKISFVNRDITALSPTERARAGMSLEERRVTGELLQPIKQHCSLVIVEHDLDFIRDICDRLTVLDQGHVLACGTVAEIQANKSVQEIYLRRA